MAVKGIVKKGEYFDSVALMILSKEISKKDFSITGSVIMGTKENKEILKMANLYLPEFDTTIDSDLIIVVSSDDDEKLDPIISNVENLLSELKNKKTKEGASSYRSLESALDYLGDANLSLISVPGKYAAHEAQKSLEQGLNVMLFSDNVRIEEEVRLKQFALKNSLLMMGPDCGTSIINGVPLGFANIVNKGKIGIVAASGTGLQEVSSLITLMGEGISQAVGTGGRDISEEVGGATFIQAIDLLEKDSETESIVLISKPPNFSVLRRIGKRVESIKKPIIACFLGAEKELVESFNMTYGESLYQTALIATNKDERAVEKSEALKVCQKLKKEQKTIRGLYSGGTFCSETKIIIKKQGLKEEHHIIDLGDDEYTVGRPHPMIDFSLRTKMMRDVSKKSDTAVVLFDIVLGMGANLDPIFELKDVLNEINDEQRVVTVCNVTGTDKDPQNRIEVIRSLKDLGVQVFESNYGAAMFASLIVKEME